jgi:GNAT superfamily N-acetyltransferase
MHYRKATAADSKKLQELGLLSYGQHRAVLGDNWKQMEANLGKENLYEELLTYAHGFVCETENELVGMAFLIPHGHPTEIYPVEYSYIRLVGVHPKYEGKGIGKRLTVMCIDYAKQAGENMVALHTSEFQNAARHIYENLGFKRVKDLGKIYDKHYYLYELPL